MSKYMAACTTLSPVYPGYVNVSGDDDGSVLVTVRGDPKTRDGIYICGHAADKGQPGRCTPGDDRCNNYCNMAPQKGPMADCALPCTQVLEGATAVVLLSADEWKALLSELAEEK